MIGMSVGVGAVVGVGFKRVAGLAAEIFSKTFVGSTFDAALFAREPFD